MGPYGQQDTFKNTSILLQPDSPADYYDLDSKKQMILGAGVFGWY